MYSSVDLSLPLAAGLVGFFFIERLVYALIGLFWSDDDDVKQVMSYQFIASCVEAVANLLFACLYAVLGMASALVTAMLWVSVVLLMGSILYVTYEQAPWVWTDLARAYNAFLGPFINTTIVDSVDLLNTVFKGVIPLWNGFFFFINRLLSGYFLPTLIAESTVIGRIGLSVYDFSKHLSLSLFAWVQTVVVSCPASEGDACFSLVDRTLDVVTPMADVRDIVGHFVGVVRNVCDPVTPLFDIVTFPLMDLNLAKGLHNIINAILYVVVQMPEITHLRCTRHGGEGWLMCTPDLDPFFSFLVTGIRDLGRMVDNWVEVVLVIVQGILGIRSSAACDGVLLAPPVLSPGAIRSTLFGANRTVTVGLGGWLMAVTDGVSIAYHGQGHTRMAAWPSPVDVKHGVAAVTYSTSSDRDATRLAASAYASTATALLGCRCVSSGGRIQLQCAVLPYEGLLANQSSLVPVFFQQGATIERSLSCSDIDIVVQSVRWPATRFSSGSTPLPDCSLTRTCNQVDATVWVVPRAGCNRESTVCNCYPFCMATRLAGSQASAMVLYSADQWRGKVFVVKRDCNLQSTSSSMRGAFSASDSVPDSAVVTTQASDESPQFIASSEEQTLSCTDNLLVTSIINRTVHPAYTSPTPAFLRSPSAPFVITGDTILTAIKRGDGEYTVQVERLTGFTGSEFTLSLVTGIFPAYPPVRVPADLFVRYPRDHVTLPYARQATLAVSSRNFVFYAVNPSMHVYDAYLNYCREGTTDLPQFGLIMTSSFSPIRIWRVDAYRRCSAAGCGADLVRQADIPDAFSDGKDDGGQSLTWDCVRTYNEGITHMEYINEANIAVTVHHTSVNGTISEYRVYWLNIATMMVSDKPWQDSAYQTATALSAYTLCPSMQAMPEIGSLAAELFNALILLVKMPIDLVTYMPGISNLWGSGTVCPLQARGHSILQECGSNAFLLDDFFDSLETATNIFWSSLTLLSAAVDDVTSDSDASRVIQNTLDGLARYGSGSIDLWTARFQVMSVMAAGPTATVQSMPMTVLTGAEGAGKWMQGGFKLTSSTLGWARFGYTCVAKIVVTITQNVLLNQPVGPGRAWRIIVNALDEMREVYDGTVVENLRQSCAGISLMLGLTNPWAVFIYQQCMAANTVVSAGLDLFLSLFSLAPFAQCMCKGSAGKVFGDHAMANCVPQASTRLRPTLVYMVQSSNYIPMGEAPAPASALCTKMLAYTKSEIVGSVQPWFDAQFASMDALAASLDYALSWFDSKAGQCLNYNEDPDVVVIMPFPSDYFQACGSTSLCRAKCAGVWSAFDSSLAASAVRSTTQRVQVVVESLFFPVLTMDAFTPMRIWALIQPSLCAQVCGGESKPGDTCLAVAGVSEGSVVVQHYCVPIMMTSSVYRTVDASVEWAVSGGEAWANDILKLQFGDANGHTLVALTSKGDVWLSSASGGWKVGSTQQLALAFNLRVVSIIDLMVMYRHPYASIHVHFLYRHVDGKITAKALHGKLVADISSLPTGSRWVNMGDSFFSSIQGYSASYDSTTKFQPSATFLLLPRTAGLPVNLLTAHWDTAEPSHGVVRWSSHTLPETPRGLDDMLAGGQVLSQNCIVDSEGAYIAFIGAPPVQSTGWLSQARISNAAAQAYDSQPTTFSVDTVRPCNVKSCAGCPDGEVQRLCDAVQRCAVINCIGTPVNMRRVLCQLGAKIADESRENLALMHGGWTIFVDMVMVILDLSLREGVDGVNLEWPDDAFFGYICTAKDQGAHYISIFTSAINSVMQAGHTAVTYVQGGAQAIDSNFHAMSTMPMTALTGFLHQVLLSPIYAMIVTQKVMMCRVQGVMAIFDATGFMVTIGNADMQAASSSLVGRCLTQSAEAQLANPSDSSNSGSVGAVVAGVARSAALALLPELTFGGNSLETIIHAIDGQLSYMMGMLLGLSDLLASMDMPHCKMPDYFLNETVFCACGDSPFAIPEARRKEGLEGAGLWCTGTLSMLDASNRPFVIYNPFTYGQLQTMAEGSDEYLACMSSKLYNPDTSNCGSLMPTVPEFQGVSVLTVLTACKNNYMNSQWDKAAYILFNQTVFRQEIGRPPPDLAGLPSLVKSAGRCLVDPDTRPVCLQEYMAARGVDPEVYWSYEDIPASSPSERVDACQVFTGPAKSPEIGPAKRSLFRACLDHYPDSNCQISSNLWTPQSDNAVPVANRHAVRLSKGEATAGAVALKFQQAHDLVAEALKPLQDYNNPDLRTVYFSPEGDIMHQMMDCVFAGPYPKVNYWPQDLLGLLPVPSWHRDANGTTRALDPRACVRESMDRSPPYSCGSHARQAVIKYFFRDYLVRQQNSSMNNIINSMAGDIRAAWGNVSNYTCLCADNRTHGGHCCRADAPDGWIPPNLRPSYQALPSSTILRELTNHLKDFYRYSLEETQVWTKYLPSETLAAYNWSADPGSAEIASHQAHFRTDKPAVGYDASEARSPLVTTALWQQCHGLLSQIFFTIPMANGTKQWTPRDMPAGEVDGMDSLDSFIRSAVHAAFTSSPLYRHYNVSYVPSESRMCRKNASTPSSWSKRIRLGSYSTGQTVLLDASVFSSPPVHGPDSFPMHGCICGWPSSGGRCFPPPNVCAAIPSLCPFPVESVSAMDLLKARWSSAWPCPTVALSDQWGVLDAGEMDDWLAGVNRDYTIQGFDLLKRGRAGLRLANFENITRQAQLVSPFERRTIQPHEATLPHCLGDVSSAFDSVAQLKDMMRRLFPVSQGVFESGTAAYCLRYTIEAAFLAVLEMAKLGSAYAAQRLVSDLWRTRCESQIALLSLCKGLDVFHPPVEFSKRLYPCPFSISLSDTSDVYMTPGCLVHSGGVFYDPCNCPAFECGPSKPAFRQFVSTCRIPFDPRNMTGDKAQLGGWRVSASEVFDSRGFVSSVLQDVDGLGNVRRGSDWAKAEGTLINTGRHCDMMADWWPEGETLPVGYHATTSCSSDETGYRTFDSAFAVERTAAAGQFTVVRMVYQNDLTRQASTIDTMAGGGGVCRSSNVGLPLIQTNRVQVCTRMQSGGDTLDPAIPVSSPLYTAVLPDSAFDTPERCSDNSSEVAWHGITGMQDSALHSVGTVPNMPSATASTYPENARHFMGVGPKARIEEDMQAGGNGWGAGCSDFALRECASDSHCPFNHFCLAAARICMHVDFRPETVDRCFRHDMCPLGLMCDGGGKCVQGHITYLNNIQGPDAPSPIEATVFSERCDEVNSDTYRTDGASPWEHVPDWLEKHGMCSNKNWYMYSLNLAGLEACAASCTSTACQFNSRVCELSLNQSFWWPQLKAEPAVFAVKPAVCDRDYEHMSGPTGTPMMGCTPKNTVVDNRVTDVDDARDESIAYARLFRNFNTDGSTHLGLMPLRNVRRTGFLGLNESAFSSTNIPINCERYQNCYAFRFTYNGLDIQRVYRQDGVDRVYADNDIFKCGVAAYYDRSASKCRLDVRSMHLYTALCDRGSTAFSRCTCVSKTDQEDAVGCSPVVDRMLLQTTCDNIVTEFTANFGTIQTNTKHLQDLFTVFTQSDGSLRAQVSGVECFEAIHASMQGVRYGQEAALGVYYPFAFAMNEVPLAWLYQCSYISGIAITASPAQISCQQYERSKNMSDAKEGNSFNFNFVRAGYRRADILRSIQRFTAVVRAAIPSPGSIQAFQSMCRLRNGGMCEMVPYCASRRDWIPNAAMPDHTRRFIAGLYQYRCIVSVRNRVLDERAQTFQEFIEENTALTNYVPDRFMQDDGIPDIVSLVNDTVAKCIEERFNLYLKWPFSLTFPPDAANLTACFRHSLPGILNSLASHLINIGYKYSNVDQAYMPNQNIRDQRMPSVVGIGSTPPTTTPTQACIFPDLASQERLFREQRISPVTGPFDGTRQFNGIPCKQYPLTYMSGLQDCRYPTPNNYTSLATLLNQVWDAMSSNYFAALRSMPGYAQAGAGIQPAELSFWQLRGRFAAWSYDVTDIRRYMSNINPDTTKEVMCVISGTRVNFTTCNDENYAALRDFTESQRQTASPIVPPGKQLTWKVSQEFLARGGIFAFANATREKERVLLRNLFDDDARCGSGEILHRVCLLSGQTVRPWVPWMSGEWNPYEMCDVRALDLDHGNLEEIWPFDTTVCKQCSDVNGQYRRDFMYNANDCAGKSGTYSRFLNVEKTAPTNLCRISMNDRERTCTHAQGMVGGGRGRAVLNHPRMSHLYGTNNHSAWPTQGGIFPRGDPVLRGADSADDGYGFLSIPGDELGATGIGLSVDSVPGGLPYLRVSHLPLLKQSGYMGNWASEDVTNWTMGLQEAFLAEDAAHAAEQAARGSSAWDCPVRRAAYYGASIRDGVVFAPAIPSPGRARRLFGNVTGNLSTHPTQSMQRGASGIGNYTTSNGFCFCPVGMPAEQDQCRIALADATHPCSLRRTIQALQGSWVQSHVFTPAATGGGDAPCQMQFDWPYVSGRLRDGLGVSGDYTSASNPAGRECHVLDRLRPFQHRYRSTRPAIPVEGKYTTDQGGVCHTGRAATLTARARVSATRCVKQSETADSIDVACEDGSKLTLSKEKSKPLDAMIDAVKASRMRCTQCSPPPTFTNSRGASIPAESSFGIPFRFSAARMAAADLRSLLCDGMGGEQNCSRVLNAAAWTSPDFMRILLTSPSSLFVGGAPAAPAEAETASTWPDGEWVFCNSTEALKSGSCRGSIPEAAWRKDRFQTCYKTIGDATREMPDAMSSVDVCLIDSNLQDLCTAVARAQALVREANCLASGSPVCALKPFLYQPSEWDVSNREFVHSSVTHFYRRIAPLACPDRTSTIVENNRALVNRCAATPVAAMYIALQACREITDTLADVLFYMLNIVINGLRLIMDMSGSRGSIVAQTVYFWEQIVHSLRGLLSVLSDMVFDMLFNMGSLGVRIYRLMQSSCGHLNTAYRYWMEVWCGIAIDLLPSALGAIRSAVQSCETGFAVLNDALDSIFTSIVPAALARMQSLGYDKVFRDREAREQAQQRQVINDNAKRSKREGKKADAATLAGIVAVAAASGAVGVDASDIGKQLALSLLSQTRVGFIVDIAQGVSDAIEMQRLMDLYPQNWTLFDFNSIYVALDVFELYVSSEQRCLAHREANVAEILNCTFPALASKDTMAGAYRVGTRCWADAQRDVGTSNLLACTASDTCYASEYDRSKPIICGSCPAAVAGYSTYGCSAITKMCTCSVPTTRSTTCSSNQECSYSLSTCQLITRLDDMSYGNQQCADCSKDVQCLMRAGSGLGRCGCMFQEQPLQKCTQMPGQFVPMTDGSKLCGYLPNADRSLPLTAVQWESLSMVKCIYLKAAHIFCTQAYRNGVAIPLAVGLAMASLTPSFQSRRLLVDGKMLPEGPFEVHSAESEYTLPESNEGHHLLLDDWNGTAEPCSSLAHAYQLAVRAGQRVQLGPIDTMHMHSCAYWRLVGRRAIEQFNLSSLGGREGFLLSVDDFAAALAQRWVLLELISKPGVFLFAMGHSPLFKPLYAAYLTLKSMAVSWGELRLQEVHARLPLNFSMGPLDETYESYHEEGWDSEDLEPNLPKDGDQGVHGPSNKSSKLKFFSAEEDQGSKQTVAGRRLLQATQTDIKFAETWLAGPFTWPPPFYTRLNSQCNLATAILQIAHDLISVLAAYYYGSFAKAPDPPRGIWDNLPNLTCSTSMKPAPADGGAIASVYHFIWGFFGINPGYVREFFSKGASTNIFTVTTSMLKCDFQATTYCSKHRKDLLASAVLIGLMYLVLYYCAGALGVSAVVTVIILAVGFVPLLLWYSYGMAFTCTPMLPTCLLDDVVHTLNALFPSQVSFPEELQISRDCLGDASKDSCLRRCSDPPVSFVEWRDTLAFGLCYTSQSLCTSLADLIGERDALGQKLYASAGVLMHAKDTRVSALLFCFGVTFVQLLPVILLLVVGATVAAYVLYLPCAFAPKLVALLGQFVVYLHAGSKYD